MRTCDLCGCGVLHEDRAVIGSWYIVCESCACDRDYA